MSERPEGPARVRRCTRWRCRQPLCSSCLLAHLVPPPGRIWASPGGGYRCKLKAPRPACAPGFLGKSCHGHGFPGVFPWSRFSPTLAFLTPRCSRCAFPLGECNRLNPKKKETLLHALFDCPAVRPAIEWVASLWVRIEGGTGPPLTPRVWLQGDPGAWRPQLEHHHQLWHTLRIAVLSAAWALRCRREARGTQFSPDDVAAACVEDMRAAVCADWRRVTSDVTRMDGVSSRLFPRARGGAAGVAPPSVAAFEVTWCGGGVVAYVAHAPSRRPALEFRLAPPPGPLA